MNLLQNNHRMSTEGRLSQQAYVLCFTLPFLATLALTAAMFVSPNLFAALGPFGIYGAALGWLLLLALGDALNIKRYHDLGHSGRLYRLCRPGIVVLPLLAFALDFFIPAQMASVGDMEATMHLISEAISPTMHPVTIALLGLTIAGVTMNVGYLSLMPGQPGANEHGPSPTGGAVLFGGNGPGGKAPAAPATAGDDPVNRALADYNARQAAPSKPAANGSRPAAAQPAEASSFGKKRR
jgi:uncharacterized membrane protein YhaH (DUF805 family)